MRYHIKTKVKECRTLVLSATATVSSLESSQRLIKWATWGSLPGDEETGAWSWPFTSI